MCHSISLTETEATYAGTINKHKLGAFVYLLRVPLLKEAFEQASWATDITGAQNYM